MEITEVGQRLAHKELELEAQGYAGHQVEAALRYAWGRAAGVALKAAPAQGEPVFLATLEENLGACARWLDGNAEAARDGDMGRGVDRARREGLALRGYRRLGVDGTKAARGWALGNPASKAGYRAFFEMRPPLDKA